MIGKIKKNINANNSNKISRTNANRSNNIRQDLIIMPMIIDGSIKPFLYSFFSGLKKVLAIKDSEKN